MAFKKGLGRGLGALLSDSEQEYDFAESVVGGGSEKVDSAQPTQINISLIEPNVNQPRKIFDENSLIELANSIRLHGVISPLILVKADGGKYMIIAGERRWRAAKRAGLLTVPAIVRDYTPLQIKEISLIDNLQREDLNPIETARAIKQLMTEYNYTQEQVADRIGKSRPAVANTLRLLALSPAVIDLIEKNQLSPGHARCLVPISDTALQFDLAADAVMRGISVRHFEKLVKKATSIKEKPQPPQQSIELKDMVNRLQRVFATKVSVLGNDSKGRIYIDYYNKDDLDRICDILSELENK